MANLVFFLIKEYIYIYMEDSTFKKYLKYKNNIMIKRNDTKDIILLFFIILVK